MQNIERVLLEQKLGLFWNREKVVLEQEVGPVLEQRKGCFEIEKSCYKTGVWVVLEQIRHYNRSRACFRTEIELF